MPHRCGANGVDIRRAHRTTATQCSPDLRRRAERRVQTDPAFTIFEVLRCGKTQIKFVFALGLIAIFDFVLDTSPRQSTNKFVFALGLIPIFDFVLDTPPRQSTNKFVFALGLIPIFDFVLDTPPRQNANKFAFALGLIPIFDFVLDTPPRQSTNKFVFALGLIVSLQKIGGGSAICTCQFVRLPSSYYLCKNDSVRSICR